MHDAQLIARSPGDSSTVVSSTGCRRHDRGPPPPMVDPSARTRDGDSTVADRSTSRLSDANRRRQRPKTTRAPRTGPWRSRANKSGSVLLSQGISPQVPSALRGLTSVFGMGTGVTLSLWPPETGCQWALHPRTPEQARAIEIQALGRLVPVGSTCCHAYTSGLSTWWSCHGPYSLDGMGRLIFERVSHLDAFSGYPFRRWLICHALGRTTDTPELRPSRSSRTRDSLRQSSFGCGG